MIARLYKIHNFQPTHTQKKITFIAHAYQGTGVCALCSHSLCVIYEWILEHLWRYLCAFKVTIYKPNQDKLSNKRQVNARVTYLFGLERIEDVFCRIESCCCCFGHTGGDVLNDVTGRTQWFWSSVTKCPLKCDLCSVTDQTK